MIEHDVWSFPRSCDPDPGPGTLSSLLCAIAVETSLAAKGCQDVLILGGHGACGRKISPRCNHNLISRCGFFFL